MPSARTTYELKESGASHVGIATIDFQREEWSNTATKQKEVTTFDASADLSVTTKQEQQIDDEQFKSGYVLRYSIEDLGNGRMLNLTQTTEGN